MSEFQIKIEKLAARCDICHQADCFDAAINYCSRCAGAANQLLDTYQQVGSVALPRDHSLDHQIVLFYLYRGMVIGMITGGLLMGIFGLIAAFEADQTAIVFRLMTFCVFTLLGLIIFGIFGISIGSLIGLFAWVGRLLFPVKSTGSIQVSAAGEDRRVR